MGTTFWARPPKATANYVSCPSDVFLKGNAAIQALNHQLRKYNAIIKDKNNGWKYENKFPNLYSAGIIHKLQLLWWNSNLKMSKLNFL